MLQFVLFQVMAAAEAVDEATLNDRKKQRSKKFKEEDFKRVCKLTPAQLVRAFEAVTPPAFRSSHLKLFVVICLQCWLCSQNEEYIRIGEFAWNRSWEVLHDTDGWKLHKGSDLDTGTVHSKRYENEGNCFKLQVMFQLFFDRAATFWFGLVSCVCFAGVRGLLSRQTLQLSCCWCREVSHVEPANSRVESEFSRERPRIGLERTQLWLFIAESAIVFRASAIEMLSTKQ